MLMKNYNCLEVTLCGGDERIASQQLEMLEASLRRSRGHPNYTINGGRINVVNHPYQIRFSRLLEDNEVVNLTRCIVRLNLHEFRFKYIHPSS